MTTIHACATCQQTGDTPTWADEHESENAGHLVIATETGVTL